MSRRLRNLLVVLFVLLLLGVALHMGLKRRPPAAADSTDPTGLVSQKLVDQFMSLEARENELNKTVWAKQILRRRPDVVGAGVGAFCPGIASRRVARRTRGISP